MSTTAGAPTSGLEPGSDNGGSPVVDRERDPIGGRDAQGRPRRLVIIGAVAAGASAAAKARRSNEECDIVLVEAGPYMSFANCGLPYYVGGEIPERDSLFVADAEQFARRFRVDLRLETQAEVIDTEHRRVTLQTRDGRREILGYDRLVLATGTDPVIPPIDNVGSPTV